MKIGSLLYFIPPAREYFSSFKFPLVALENNAVYELSGFDPTTNNGIYLKGIKNMTGSDGVEISYHKRNFREIEFPPSLDSEIKESLTRELITT